MKYATFHNDLIEYINFCPSKGLKHYDEPNIVFLDFSKGASHLKPEYAGVYDAYNGQICVHRINLFKPNISYLDEITVLMHEWGHYNNVLPFADASNISSITGYRYSTKVEDQPYYQFKEEVMAWINGYRLLWNCFPFQVLSVYAQVVITMSIVIRSIDALLGYLLYSIIPNSVRKLLK